MSCTCGNILPDQDAFDTRRVTVGQGDVMNARVQVNLWQAILDYMLNLPIWSTYLFENISNLHQGPWKGNIYHDRD